MSPGDEDTPWNERLEALRAEPVARWTHQIADLDGPRDTTYSTDLDRPIMFHDRDVRLREFLPTDVPRLSPAWDRRLSPREPYQSSPLSFMNTSTQAWRLQAESDELLWMEFPGGSPLGGIDFSFRGVVADTIALVTLEISAGPTHAQVGTVGSVEIAGSASQRRSFPINWQAKYTLDVVVRPKDSYGVIILLTGSGLDNLTFREITYQTL